MTTDGATLNGAAAPPASPNGAPARPGGAAQAPAAGGSPPARPRARAASWPVMAGAAGTFFAALAFLAGQVRAGGDPALGPAPAATAQPRQVVVRRIERKVIVTEPAPAARTAAAAPAASAPGPAPAPAVAPAAPAPAPAPPPPAPLTTSSS